MYMRKVDLRIQFCLFVTQKTNCKTTHASNLDVLMTHKHDNHNIKLVSNTCVAVPSRNYNLFRCVFWCVRSAVEHNVWRAHEVKYLPPKKWPTIALDFTMTKTSCFNMKVLVFAEPGHMQPFSSTENLNNDLKCCPFSDHTNVSCNLQLLSLVQILRLVHHSQATSISYTFLAADYRSSTASLATGLYTAAHPMHLWWQQHFFRILTDVSQKLSVGFLAPTQLTCTHHFSQDIQCMSNDTCAAV